jgi:hypothetical protein
MNVGGTIFWIFRVPCLGSTTECAFSLNECTFPVLALACSLMIRLSRESADPIIIFPGIGAANRAW